MPRHVFYSFHYLSDSWRASQVRNLGIVDGNKAAHDNDWESIKRGGDAAIERWIQNQMQGRSCTIVLVGSETARRKWIDYEIIQSWKNGMGVAAIHIHALKDSSQRQAQKGANPFEHLSLGSRPFSQVVKCYNPPGFQSTEVYAWISKYLSDIVEEAVAIRKAH